MKPGPPCSCGNPSSERTVRKDGPNKGRPFFSCAKTSGQDCGFFQWGDEDPALGFGGKGGGNPLGVPTPMAPGPPCNCGNPSSAKTVRKDGPNKGRPMYVCAKASGQDCGFFQWGDEDPALGFGGGKGGGKSGKAKKRGGSGAKGSKAGFERDYGQSSFDNSFEQDASFGDFGKGGGFGGKPGSDSGYGQSDFGCFGKGGGFGGVPGSDLSYGQSNFGGVGKGGNPAAGQTSFERSFDGGYAADARYSPY